MNESHDLISESWVIHQDLAQKHQILEVYLIICLLFGLNKQPHQIRLKGSSDDFCLICTYHVLKSLGNVDFVPDIDLIPSQQFEYFLCGHVNQLLLFGFDYIRGMFIEINSGRFL